jgi:TRAP-type C4-dicarboxylate transport system permease small subunit
MQQALRGLAALILFVLMVLGTADVVGRYFFSAPIRGASELIELLMAALVFAAFPVVTVERAHITVDLFRASARLQSLKRRVGGVVVCGCLALFVYCVLRQAARVASMGDVTDLLRIPKAPIFYFMAASCGLALLLVVYAFARPRAHSRKEEAP